MLCTGVEKMTVDWRQRNNARSTSSSCLFIAVSAFLVLSLYVAGIIAAANIQNAEEFRRFVAEMKADIKSGRTSLLQPTDDTGECLSVCACVYRDGYCNMRPWARAAHLYSGPDLRGRADGPGPRPPANRSPPTKPFIIYFSLMIDAYETTT